MIDLVQQQSTLKLHELHHGVHSSLHHNFTDIVRELYWILNWQSFDQQCLVVQQASVQVQLLLDPAQKRLSTIGIHRDSR